MGVTKVNETEIEKTPQKVDVFSYVLDGISEILFGKEKIHTQAHSFVDSPKGTDCLYNNSVCVARILAIKADNANQIMVKGANYKISWVG